MTRRVRGLILVVLLGLFATGAGPGTREAEDFRAPQSVERRFVDVRWDTVFAVGSLRDMLLSRPRLLAAHEGRIYVYDYFAHQVIAMQAERVQAMQAEKGVFYVSSEDPYPRILGLRPVPVE